MLGACGANEVIQEAKRRFDRHYETVIAGVQSNDLIPADLRVAVYSTCMLNYGSEVYERLLHVGINTSTNLLDILAS